MIELTFTGKDLAEIKEGIASFLDEAPKKAVQKTVEAKDEALKERLHEAMFEDDPEDDDTPSVTLAEIQALTKAKLEEKKSKAIKALLADFGAAKVAGLEEEDYAAFYEKLEEL